MTALKIINWAANQIDGSGGHILALTEALNSGRLPVDVIDAIYAKRSEWQSQHDARFCAS